MLKSIRRSYKTVHRKSREARLFVQALTSAQRPVLAHLVPIRRCNLACEYCNEFDRTSDPVPTEEMLARVDRLAELETLMIHLSGGEPMLHPDLERIIRRIREHGMMAGLLTNGLLLSPRRIRRLNEAGLDHLQISIDNVVPDDVSKKSLRVLDKKLQWLSEGAEFGVNINSVLGNDLESPEDALVIAKRARELGLSSTVGILHDHQGQLKPLGPRQKAIYDEIQALDKPLFRAASHNRFQENMVRGRTTDWHCRAGSRYLYICEDGRVHYCSQQRGAPGIPLRTYTSADLQRQGAAKKSCAPHCTVSCVHRVSWLDELREEPRQALQDFFPPEGEEWSPSDLPLPVRGLTWLFLPPEGGARPGLATRLALRLFRAR